MSHTFEFICLRSNRRIQCEPLAVSYADKALAKREAKVAARKKTVELGRRVAARMVTV